MNNQKENINEIPKIKKQTLITNIALLTFVLILVTAFVSESLLIRSVADESFPIIDEAIEEAKQENFTAVSECSERMLSLIERRQALLKVFISHRDLGELIILTHELVDLKGAGDKETYIAALSAVRADIELLFENSRITLGNIL